MKPRDHAEVAPWLELAKADLHMADLALADVDATPALFGLVCFHAQQAAEKVLKGVLIGRDQPVPRTHSLVLLVDCCYADLESVPASVLHAAAELNDFGVGPRYPGAAIATDFVQATAARVDGETIWRWALGLFDAGTSPDR